VPRCARRAATWSRAWPICAARTRDSFCWAPASFLRIAERDIDALTAPVFQSRNDVGEFSRVAISPSQLGYFVLKPRRVDRKHNDVAHRDLAAN